MSLYVVEVQDVSVQFGGLFALDKVSMGVKPGEVLGVIGPNGAGKSTLLNTISGLVRPAHGDVLLDQVSIRSTPPHRIAREGIARTFQGVPAIPELSAEEQVLLSARSHGMRPAERRVEGFLGRTKGHGIPDDPAAVLRYLGVHRSRARLTQLSYGHRKLADIARALYSRPKVLFYDEPCSGLSASERRLVAAAVVQIKNDLHLAQVLVEHDMATVREICDRVIVLNFGVILAQGSPADVFKNSAVIAAYYGDSDRASL